jgi:hypothetical protein
MYFTIFFGISIVIHILLLQGAGGNRFVQTGYYLITQLLSEDFDRFIADMTPPILEIERQIVNDQLCRYTGSTQTEKYEVLIDRQNELKKSVVSQEKFDPKRIVSNKHTS